MPGFQQQFKNMSKEQKEQLNKAFKEMYSIQPERKGFWPN